MRLLSRLLVVLVVCLVAMTLSAVPTQANGTEITLFPISGVPGDTVRVSGYNFTDDGWVDIYYCLDAGCMNASRIWVGDDEIDGGSIRITFILPESYTGLHQVRAYLNTSLKATRDFTVRPGLTVSPAEGPVGTNVTVEGHGFAKNETNIELMPVSFWAKPCPSTVTLVPTGPSAGLTVNPGLTVKSLVALRLVFR